VSVWEVEHISDVSFLLQRFSVQRFRGCITTETDQMKL